MPSGNRTGSRRLRLLVAGTLGALSVAVGLVSVPSLAAKHVGYEESSAAVTYSGSWTAFTDSRYTGGRMLQTEAGGAAATFKFTGTAVRWISSPRSGWTGGRADVHLDGALVATIDTAGVGYGEVVFERRGLAAQAHVLRITHHHSWAKSLVIDRFLVDPGSPPTALPTPVGLSATGSPNSIGVAWSATTHADQVGYHLYRATAAAGPYERVNIRPLTWTSYRDLNVWSGRQYFYKVRATDAWDNESPDSAAASARVTATFRTVKRYEEGEVDSGSVYLNPQDSGGSASWVTATSFTFYGTAIEWIGRKGPDGGVATVVLDGQESRHDTYRPTAAHQQVLFSRTGLPEKLHHLTIYGGRGTFRSSGRAVFLDSLVVGLTGKVPTTLTVEPMRTWQDAGAHTTPGYIGQYCDSIYYPLGAFGGLYIPFCTPAVPVPVPFPAADVDGGTSEIRAQLSEVGWRGVGGAAVRFTLRRDGSVVATCDTVTEGGSARWTCPTSHLVRAGDNVTAEFAGDDVFAASRGSSEAYQVLVNGNRIR